MENEEMPPLEEDVSGMNCSDDSDFGDTDDEMDACEEKTTCLFCKNVLPSVDAAIQHLRTAHSVDFTHLKCKFSMDQYSFIKLINCIRCGDMRAEQLVQCEAVTWNDEKYLKPKEYESWLTYDYEQLPDKTKTEGAAQNDLSSVVETLREKVKAQALLLEQAAEDMAKMRASFQRVLEKESAGDKARPVNCVAAASPKADESYFSSYDRFSIHHEMLSDVVRTTSYRDALLKNKSFVSGKDVLDVGCGTSVLSIFASQAGAKSVVGIDNSDIIYNAMDIVKRNKVENITLVKGRLEDTELPQQRFDIIISEWMGYFLLFEGMLDSVIYARDYHLKEGGTILPNRCTMSLIGYGSDALYKNHVTFWSDVYGLDMSNMRKDVLHEPLIDVVDSEHILTEPNTIADLNMATVDLTYSNFTYDFQLPCTKDGQLSAFVGYFDTYFDLPTPVMFGTAPTDKPTHWKQAVFFVEQPQAVKAGQTVSGRLTCRRGRSSARSLDITIDAFGRQQTYYLD